jgi:putative ATP-binding cassette transporter
MAFLHVMGAFSIIVKEFQRISAFGAVVERLGGFVEALDDEEGPRGNIQTVEDADRVAFDAVTLLTPDGSRLIVRDLCVEVPRGKSLLVFGPKGSGRTAILRAAAGLWTVGEGAIVRPPLTATLFLPQQPYLRAGTLREQLLYATGREGATDDELYAALRAVRFQPSADEVLLDEERDWPNTLSLGEQQLLAFARLLLARPAFAFLDEPTSAVSSEKTRHLYEALAETGISYVTASSDAALRKHHDIVVELLPGGRWRSPSTVRAATA